MRPRKIIAMVMTFLMMLSLLPSLVFAAAAPEGELGGQLKIKGTAAVGSELSADYEKVTPEGLTDDYVTFSWSRKIGDQLTEVGTEKTYKLVDEDLGNKIELKITGKTEMGVTGELKVNTVEIVATPEEAPEETTELPEGEQDTSEEETTEEIPVEEISAEEPQTDENAQPAQDAGEDTQSEEVIDIGAEEPADPSADVMQPVDGQDTQSSADNSQSEITTDDSVIDIGTEDYLEVPENGQSENPVQGASATEETVQQEPVYAAEVVAGDIAEDGTVTLDFGTVNAGFTQDDANSSMVKTITIKNTGNSTLNFKEISPEHFMVKDLGALGAGESADAWVMPREGTAAGEYSDTITYTTEEGVEVSFTAKLTVAEVETGDTNADLQPAEEPATPETTPEVTPEVTPETTPEVTPEATPEVTPETTPEVTPEVTPETTPEVTPEVTPETTPEVTPEATPEITPAPSFTTDISEVKFDSKEAGYTEAPAAATINVSNTGNVKLTGIAVSVTGSEFAVSTPSATELEANANQSVSFTVTPVVGLAAGTYTQTVSVKTDQTDYLNIPVSFTVTEAATKLMSVGKVSDISLANGAEKSADGLQLPSTVKITTSKGDMNASVKWDVKGSAYNQNSTDAQKFSVKGTVVLPDGVTNPDNLSLVVSVNVSVSRGPIVSDAANNTITGISSDGNYTTETKITFTAVGAGTDIENPIKGDVRYLPLNWEVLEARSWDGAPYSATFRMGKNGNYTLTVTYNQQQFDGSNWVNTGTQDTKQVNFTVNAAPNQTLTPAADKTDANQKNAVKTGDNTPILPFVIILIVAIVLIAGILVYRNKKK